MANGPNIFQMLLVHIIIEICVIADYARTGAAFSIIALLLSSGANFFSWYSINEPRYMFKRVAGSLHLITG